MKELNIGGFRDQCLSILKNVPEEGITITEGGIPVAQLTRIEAELIDRAKKAK